MADSVPAEENIYLNTFRGATWLPEVATEIWAALRKRNLKQAER